jgi:glutamine synthetase
MSALNQQLVSQCIALEAAIGNPPHGTSGHFHHCAETLLPLMAEIRSAADGLERLVDEALWPLPTYQELLFMR